MWDSFKVTVYILELSFFKEAYLLFLCFFVVFLLFPIKKIVNNFPTLKLDF